MRTPTDEQLESADAAARRGFGLDPDVIEPIPSWNSVVFRLRAGGASYALRVHEADGREPAAVRAELAFLRHLRSYDLPVPLPIPTVSGDDLFIEGGEGVKRAYDVTTWVGGVVRRDGLDAGDAECLGATLARIHVASRTFTAMPDLPVPVHDELWLIEHAGPDALQPIADWLSPTDRMVFESALHKIQRTLATLRPDGLETATLHKDFILGNCLWHDGGLSVIDFAEARLGPMLYDLAPMLTNIGDQPGLRRAFLAGYRTVRALPGHHEAALPAMEAIRHISSCFSMITSAQQGRYGPALDVHVPYRVSGVETLLPAL